MIFLILAIIGLTLLGFDRIVKTFWAFADAIHDVYVAIKNN